MPFQLQDPYDISTGDTGTTRGIPSAPPMPELPPAPPAGHVFNPKISLPTPPPPPLPPPPAAAAPIAPAPPIGGQNDLSNYLAQQNEGLSKYGPEQQMAVEQDILKRRQGFPQVAGNAMTGFADALMQGVARAGPSNFQQNLQNRNDKTEEGMRSAMEKANTSKMAQMKMQRDLAQDDPGSPLSRAAQRAAAPLFKSLGMTDDEIASIPASLAAQAQTNRLSLEEIRAKAEETRALREQTGIYQEGMLANTRRGQAQTAAQAAATQAANEKKARMDAAAEVLKRRQDTKTKVFGTAIPWTSDISSKDADAAQKVLVEGTNPPSASMDFGTEAEADAAGLPSGTIVKIGGRRARIK